ncbi:MAG TPA: tRNA pseudouridine(38-40) synthase TruA [Verrucomicrobiae bacterium]|jgi:tRNA pseudouridine38-40 synthase|nr:tRNA pseudouridine(38-40) synthase TruA [Verrucomicrobiae bacterium]
MKLKLTIAYDGSNYAGWQTQKTGIGVQQRVEEAIAKIFPNAGPLRSSSRTDTGVHALGMVADVEIPSDMVKMPVGKIALAVNAHLPCDIRVMAAVRCRDNFEARFSAKGKQYRYFIWMGVAMNPLLRQRAWHVSRLLDLAAMRSAAKLFLGRHDFKSLAATRNYEMSSTVRTLARCDIKRNGPLLTFVIEGDGFLYKMCRGIVGTLAQVGQGKIPPGAIKEILAKKDRTAAGMTAPAHGLVLWKVFY